LIDPAFVASPASRSARMPTRKARLPVAAPATGPAPASTPEAVPASDATRDLILVEAARLFRHQGYAATTLRQIADAAGIKAGSIYYHFGSKDEILGLVLDRGINVVIVEVHRRVDALPPGATHRQRVVAAIEGHLFGLLQHGDFTSANIRLYGQIPLAAKNRHRVVRRAYADYWDTLLQNAMQAGELRSDTNLAVMRLYLIGALNWTVEWFNPQRGSFKSFVDQIAAIVFDGIGPTEAAAPPRLSRQVQRKVRRKELA
jgi:TetR/AcrR family transcriptional regulator, cholesterol catabolism regulator